MSKEETAPILKGLLVVCLTVNSQSEAVNLKPLFSKQQRGDALT
jgi:hypothetical protein